MDSTSKSAARSFGVTDYDSYWVNRKAVGTDRLTSLQRLLADCVASLVPPDGTALDCGVGPGNIYRLLAQSGRRMYGIEISDEAFSLYDFDSSRIVKRDLNDGLGDFPVKFDCIIAAHIIHHLDYPELFFQQARRLLTGTGCIVVAIPNITYYKYRLGFLFGRFPPISLAHRNFQTPREFELLARSSGFAVARRLPEKRTLRARLSPTLFSQNIIYVLNPSAPLSGASSRPA